LARALFIRVPLPAARITACSFAFVVTFRC
jgi:hypothetical protein